MARRSKIEIEAEVLDPLKDRMYVQEVTYLAHDGRPITERKTQYLDHCQRTLMGLLAEGQGMEVVHVEGERS